MRLWPHLADTAHLVHGIFTGSSPFTRVWAWRRDQHGRGHGNLVAVDGVAPHNTTTERAAAPLAVEDFINNFRKPLMQPILLSPPHKAGGKE